LPDLAEQIGRGEFAPLFDWLRTQIHGKGSLLSTADLVLDATGTPLGTAAFERHLRERYLE
jgi:carboxypeptidase Taq